MDGPTLCVYLYIYRFVRWSAKQRAQRSEVKPPVAKKDQGKKPKLLKNIDGLI